MAKEISLVNKKGIALVDDEDYPYLLNFKWYFIDGYAARVGDIDGKRVWTLMHREIMKTPKGMDTDHINMQRMDNRKSNLRIATRSENMANTKAHKDKKIAPGLKGVTLANGKWRARIFKTGRNYHLGVFDTAEQAAEAYRSASISINGVFTNQ